MKLWWDMNATTSKDMSKVILCLKDHLCEELEKYPLKMEDFIKNIEKRTYTKTVQGTKINISLDRSPLVALNSIIKQPRVVSVTPNSPSPAYKKFPLRPSCLFYPEDQNPMTNIKESPAIVEAKMSVEKRIIKLIVPQRLNFMVHGQSVQMQSKNSFRDRTMPVFFRLSNNHKYLYYRDMSNVKKDTKVSKTTIFSTKEMIVVDNILKVETSARPLCDLIPEVSDPYGGMNKLPDLMKLRGFEVSIFYESDSSKVPKHQDKVTIYTLDQKTFDYWCDGLNVLMGKRMTSDRFKEEYEAIENIELRMSYLQVDRKDKTKSFPKIPPPPSNYNFSRKYYSNGKPLVPSDNSN